jgi:hypothetical protein
MRINALDIALGLVVLVAVGMLLHSMYILSTINVVKVIAQ